MAEQDKAEAKAAPVTRPGTSVAKLVTWSGDDDDHHQMTENEKGEPEQMPAPGPSFMHWARVRFDKDKPVLIDPAQAPTPELKLVYEHILKKAPHMVRFKVEDVGEEATAEDGDSGEDEEGKAKRSHHAKPHIQPVPKRRR